MPKHIFGIDPSLTGTGICVLRVPDEELLHTSTISPKKITGVARLDWIMKQFSKTLDKFFCTGDPIFIEGYAFGARGRGIFNIGELGGIMRLFIAKKYGGYYEIPPTTMKKFICGKGNANKNVVLERVFRKYGIGSEILKDDNQVDAYALAKMGMTYMKFDDQVDNGTLKLADYEAVALQGVGEECTL